MTDEIFDRYKDALRAGHVAVLRGRLDEALVAYRAAEAIAPGRALPHASLGGVLLDLGRVDDALEELRIAVELAPRDEGALLGRSEALVRAGRPAEAAASLDALADVQAEAGRLSEAVETLQRALVLEERVGRRRRYQRAVRDLRVASGGRLSDGAARLALPLPEPAVAPAEAAATGSAPAEAAIAPVEPAPAEAPATPSPAETPAEPAESVEPAQPPTPELEPLPLEPRLAGDALVASAEAAVALGDAPAALEAYRQAARVFDEAGLPIAALDACREALALAPDDVEVHLRYASIYRSKGWREIAANRLASILRLVDLAGDVEGRERIRAVIVATYPDDERLMGMCA
ncbi:MAG: tetratricopeptide repeat protein [Chloroflexi bacterium]|nr:tetratricopeptide repeat protein [Chloroflexota bacterium]